MRISDWSSDVCSSDLLVLGEVVVVLAIGFVLQMGLAAALPAGEAISNAMGLGFASMIDPLSGTASSAIGQFLSVLATALFLAADGHLVLIDILVDSYRPLPPGGAFLSSDAIGGIMRLASPILAPGL